MPKVQPLIRKVLIFLLRGYIVSLLLYLALRLIFEDRLWWLGFINTFSFYLFIPLLFIVPIVFALHQKQLLFVALVLLVIGIVWISPYLLPKAVPTIQPNDSTFRILTFNTSGENKQLSDVEKYATSLNADIVLMQEIPEVYAMNKVPALKAIYPNQFGHSWKWGNIVLSKYPFIKAEDITLIKQKNAFVHQRIVINLEGQNIAIYSIQLPCPSCTVKPRIRVPGPWFLNLFFAYDDNQRNAELEGLLHLLDNETLPYIVAGDFNLSSQSPTYTKMIPYAKDAFREVGMGLGFSWPVSEFAGFPTFIPPLVRIDYIWYSNQFEAITAQQGPVLGSDHLPLWATLRLKTANP